MPNFYTRREPDEDCPRLDYLHAYIISELSFKELSKLDKIHYPNCFIQQSSFKEFKGYSNSKYKTKQFVEFI